MSSFERMFPPGTGCRNCTERHVGCHSECEIYIEACKKWKESQKQLKSAKKSDKDYREFKVANVRKTIKRLEG